MPDLYGNLTQEEREAIAKKRQEMLDGQARDYKSKSADKGPDEGESPAPAAPAGKGK